MIETATTQQSQRSGIDCDEIRICNPIEINEPSEIEIENSDLPKDKTPEVNGKDHQDIPRPVSVSLGKLCVFNDRNTVDGKPIEIID